MSPQKRRLDVRYDTDKAALVVLRRLLSDFRSVHDHFRPDLDEAAFSSIESLRTKIDSYDTSTVHLTRFKSHAQINSLLKKYRFRCDQYSDQQLEEMTMEKFIAVQKSLDTVEMTGLVQTRVLSVARKHARRILGVYHDDDTIAFQRFGTKASIGCPLRLAHIDEKLSTVKAFSGSGENFIWFKQQVLDKDPMLKGVLTDILPSKGESCTEVSTLILHLVPKSFKTLRPITPLPLLDLYRSNGVGGLIQDRLSHVGIRITNLQEKHASYVQDMSRSKRRFFRTEHTTADLSAASDTITGPLLNRILPRDWYNAVKPLFCRRLEYKGTVFTTHSVIPMGNGVTFPLETLVFYVILLALSELTGIKGKISVYGDDLIYPSRLHKYVVWVFPKLGLQLNLSKTFSTSRFRESCGADFYHGADVRPFFLKGEHSLLTRTAYEAFLYKLYNGLRRRWEECEIPSTLTWILYELANVTDSTLLVPPSFPDTAGIHVQDPSVKPMGIVHMPLYEIRRKAIGPSPDSRGTTLYIFRALRETAQKRWVKHVEPYYWLSLRCQSDIDVGYNQHRAAGPLTDEGSKPELTWKLYSWWVKTIKKKNGQVKGVKVAKVFKAQSSEKLLTKIERKTGQVYTWA